MSRKTVRLTLDGLASLPAPVRGCLFWELSPVDRGRLADAERAAEKEAWVSEVLREWGSCGRIALVDGDPVGLAIYAPAAWLPGAMTLPTAPSSPDAVVLGALWVDPQHRGGGVGRLLIQGMARDLVRRGHAAVEAYGRAGHREESCVVPVGFLSGVGFRTQRPHPTVPRMRMDLRSTLRWKSEVEQALERLWGAVRPTQQKATRPIGAGRLQQVTKPGVR